MILFSQPFLIGIKFPEDKKGNRHKGIHQQIGKTDGV